MRPPVRSGILCLAFLDACHSASPPAAPAGTGLTMVAPGIVSTDLPEFALTISADGNEMYFNRASADRAKLTIMTTQRTGGTWKTPVVAPFSGTWRDVDPFLAPDGQRLYFSSNRPRTSSSVASFSTWYVERSAAGWSDPVDPGLPLNSDSSDVFASVSRDGELYFSSTRDGRPAIYVSRNAGGTWTLPVRVELGTAAAGAGNPMISPDGRVLLMSLVKPDGDTDIVYACRVGNGWTPPRALPAPVNSSRADFAPAIDVSGSTLYFTSERPGIVGAQPDSVRPPGDIYRIPLGNAGIDCR